MEWKQVYGNTYAVDVKAGTLMFYKTGEREGILVDTGFAKEDREPLAQFLEETGVRPIGIIISHTHYDHAGNAGHLQQRYHCPILASLTEAGMAVNPTAYRPAYPSMTPKEITEMMSIQCYQANEFVLPGERVKEFCGVPFGILPLYGHTPGQIGVVTPDNVAYLADVLMCEKVMYASKMPSAVCRVDDMRAKESLRTLRCNAYVLAHRGVYDDISELTEKNIQYIFDRTEIVYSCLEGEMSKETWIRAVCRRLEIHSTHAFKCAVAERNIGTFIEYLADSGRVAIARREGVCWYRRSED